MKEKNCLKCFGLSDRPNRFIVEEPKLFIFLEIQRSTFKNVAEILT